jgi:ribonuclease VapC
MAFVDASAMVAILSRERNRHEACLAALMTDEAFYTSPLAIWECVAALGRKVSDGAMVGDAASLADSTTAFLEAFEVSTVFIGARDWELAWEAWQSYGRQSGHPAKLNMADCFHHALARQVDGRILFTSPEEFHHTDLKSVLPKR